MKDIVFVALTVGFFLLAWLYVRACERHLRRRHEPRIRGRSAPVASLLLAYLGYALLRPERF